ncbi:unnamed protein product [Owenia fusiformis]|uniref:Uncharacterized protein n=1 Tax=Owenia fusiformis TaxID=6347 RepID=A0A8J1THK4_OWEFU|nr:unnamed protein product [Owenia fusiformis]
MDSLMLKVFLLLLPFIKAATVTDALLCYKCTYINFYTDENALKEISNQLLARSQQACQFNNEYDDKHAVEKEGCSYAPSGYVNKCLKLESKVTASFLGNDYSFDIIKRGCVQVTDEGRWKGNGCKTDPGEDFIKQITDDVENLHVKDVRHNFMFNNDVTDVRHNFMFNNDVIDVASDEALDASPN